jgi:hypothetical protein
VQVALPIQLSYQPCGSGSAMRSSDDHFPAGDEYVQLFWLAVQEGIVALAKALVLRSRPKKKKKRKGKRLAKASDKPREDDPIIDRRLGPLEETPLIHACRAGDENMVRFLLEEHADYRRKDDSDMTALMHACEHGHLSVVRGIRSFVMNDCWELDPNNPPGSTNSPAEAMKTFDEMLKAYTVIGHETETTEDLEQDLYKQMECWYRCGNTAIHAAAHSGDLELG